jgi:hypothetical protein
MVGRESFNLVKPNLVRFLGTEIAEALSGQTIIGVKPKTENEEALIALRNQDMVVCAGRSEWQKQPRELFDILHPGFHFSVAS